MRQASPRLTSPYYAIAVALPGSMPEWSGTVTDEVSATRRYLAVHLPFLSAERALKTNAAPPDTAFVLTEKVRGAVRLAQVDAHALALGIVPGLTLADARARLPGLLAVAHDSAADTALLEWLADSCELYTPMAAVNLPQGVVLDITGCVEPYGSETALAASLQCRLLRQRMTAQLACAGTPEAALALAAYKIDDVHMLPVAALRISAETRLALTRAGLKTVGDLAQRPRAPLVARFGPELPKLLARLLGETNARITPRRALQAVVVEQRFAEPVTHSDAALDTLNRLTIKASVILNCRGAGGRQFEAALFRSDGHVARLRVETGQPVRDPKVIARLFAEKIDTLSDPLDPGFGYDLIRLAVPVTEPLIVRQPQLDGDTVADAEVTALLDRLSARLGRHRVRRFRLGDTHIPEQSAFELAVAETMPPCSWPALESGEPPLRPLHLFEPPQRIEVLAEVPDGPPRRFRWRAVQHEVTRYEGPERIAAEWWKRRSGRGLTRDYYRIEDVRGRRFWVFRHGLYGTEKPVPDWYLHGLFA